MTSARVHTPLDTDAPARRRLRPIQLAPGQSDPPPAAQEEDVLSSMRHWRPSLPKLWLVASDSFFLLLAIALAWAVGVHWLDTEPSSSSENARAAIIAFAAVLVMLAQQRTYKARYLSLRREEYARVIKAVLFGLGATIVLGYLFEFVVPQWIVGLLGTATVLLLVDREIARRVFRRLRLGGHLVRRAVIVGSNGEADELTMELMASKELGYEVVASLATVRADGHRVAAATLLADLDAVLEQTSAGTVIVATSATDLETAGHLARRLTDSGLHVEMCVPLRDIEVTRLRLRPLGRFPVFYVEPVDRNGWRPVAKRVFDVTASLLALVVVSPVLLVAAIAIKLNSKGPVLFRQERVGRHGKRFPVLKLRTMVDDAEDRLSELMKFNEASGPVFKMRNDPRVTPVGRFLRKFSIDELPQLWNVVRGEMSLVGPRPALPSEVDRWSDDLYERLRVRPGITGMWQVSGRTDASGDDYVRLDLYYVDNWSLLMDLIVLGKTLPAVLSGRGAY